MSRAGARPTDGRGPGTPAQPSGSSATPAASPSGAAEARAGKGAEARAGKSAEARAGKSAESRAGKSAESRAGKKGAGASEASNAGAGTAGGDRQDTSKAATAAQVDGPGVAGVDRQVAAAAPVDGPGQAGVDRQVAATATVDGPGVAAGEAPEAAAPWAGWEALIRAGGVVVSILAAFFSGVIELLLSTLRAGDVVSVWRGDAVVLAVAGNIGIAWFAVHTTGRRWALGPPWAVWTIVMLIAAGVRTHEGDYLLSGDNYIALAMILIGSLTFAIYTYRMILQRIPPAVSTSATPPGKSADRKPAKRHN
jgi:hypothetical protein